MGCDIHIVAQKRVDGGEWVTISGLTPFDCRSYGMFGFLADVRNYSAVPPIAQPRGLPVDYRVDDDVYLGDHSYSWLSVTELLAFDYDAEMEDRRYMKQTGPNSFDGGATCDPGKGKRTTFRKFLGGPLGGMLFFKDLEKLRAAGAERVVFGFDS